MIHLLQVYGEAALAVFICLTVLWAVSVAIRDASIIDIFWGAGFVVCNWVSLALYAGDISSRQWLVHALVTLWGLRLAIHLFIRNAGHGEDARYQRWRAAGGPNWWLKTWYRIYLFQGLIMMIVAAPVIVVNMPGAQPALGWLDGLGLLVWLCGFTFEVVSDQQLIVFKRNPDNSGKVLDTGLWRYSLHPNYFGDALQWWGIWLVVAGAPGGIYTFIGPALMTATFIFISNGVLERALTRSRPDYKAHIERTSRFFPLPPRR